ncbi:MAG TPA: DNA translocase FtsK 4TM domain-containing protein, partial [Actinomycetota bacterium]|nr:DNA translocase FtsK 4TM domain-containing protein [Actinomycetota bacterium]
PAAQGRGRKQQSPVLRATKTAVSWSARQVRDAPAEAWGVVVLFAAALAGLGVYSDAAGPVGGVFDYLGRLMIGRLVVLVPALLAIAGFLVAIPRFRAHAVRVLVGLGLLYVALAGVTHLLQGNRSISAPLERLQRMGGIFGALIARPASGLVGVWGTWALLLVLMFVGLLVVTRTPLSRVGGWIAAGATGAAGFVRGLASGSPDEDDDADEDDEDDEDDVYELEDEGLDEQAGDEEAAPAPGIAEVKPAKPTQLAIPVGDSRSYRLPPIELLAKGGEREISARSIEDTTRVLEGTLEQFNVDASVTGYTAGPTVTRFEIELGAGVKVNRVLSLSNEIKYALASGELRFLAPIPGRSAIGVEVPNRSRQLVTLGDVLRAKEAQRDKHPLAVALGQDISGETVLANVTEMPHVLIAGATNSGKSSCINSMITSILMRARPDQVRMILIDPKRVELTHFSGVPHLLTPVVTVPKKAASALGWVVREMEMRYETLAHSGMRNLEFYNEAVARGAVVKRSDDEPDPEPLPYILVVVDELS